MSIAIFFSLIYRWILFIFLNQFALTIFLILKLNGKWDGEVYYTFADGPRKGKRDLEKWSNGELVSSKKYYGKDEAFEVVDWEDLEKMQHCCENSTAS